MTCTWPDRCGILHRNKDTYVQPQLEKRSSFGLLLGQCPPNKITGAQPSCQGYTPMPLVMQTFQDIHRPILLITPTIFDIFYLSYMNSLVPSISLCWTELQNNYLHRVSKKLCKIVLSELRQISTNFDNFWQKGGKEAKIMRGALIFHLI